MYYLGRFASMLATTRIFSLLSWFDFVILVPAYISPVISSSTSIITVSNSKNLIMLYATEKMIIPIMYPCPLRTLPWKCFIEISFLLVSELLGKNISINESKRESFLFSGGKMYSFRKRKFPLHFLFSK